MSDVQANIIVKVVDQATKGLQAIRQGVGGLDKAVKDHAADIRNFGIAATVAGGAIVAAMGSAVGAAREQMAADKQLNAVLASTKGAAGLTSGELHKMATALEGVTNFADETILSSQGIILQFTNIGKNIFPQASEAALNISQRLGRDLTTVSLQLGKALNEPAQAMNALTRAGVQLSVEQGDLIKSLVDTGHTAEAQQVLLQLLQEKYGGAARAAADPFKQLKNDINNVQEEIGMALIPTLAELIKAVTPVIRATSEWMRQHPELTKLVVVLVAAVGGLVALLGSMALALSAVTAGLAAVGLTLALGGALFVGLAGVGLLVAELTKHWEGLKFMAGEAIDYIMDKVNGLLGALTNIRDQFVAFFDLVGLRVKQAAGQVMSITGFGGAPPAGSPAPVPRAAGGRTDEPVTLVGEHGPELVSLPRGSYVHTASESRGMTGPTVTIGEIHVHNEADEDRLIGKLTRMIQLQRQQAA